MLKTTKTLIAALALHLAACGGSAKKETTTPAPQAATENKSDAVATAPALPLFDPTAAPVSAPSSLTTEVALHNPNEALISIGLFVDSVQPGMGAFISTATLQQQLGSIVGVMGLSGINWNAPMYILFGHSQQAILVATIENEADLRGSLEGVTGVVAAVHDGFAVIGAEVLVREFAPYALSTRIKQGASDEPTISFNVKNLMASPSMQSGWGSIKEQLVSAIGQPGFAIFESGLKQLEKVDFKIAASQDTLQIRAITEFGEGIVKEAIAKQRPSRYPITDRIGMGPWSAFAAGRLDLSPLSPHLVRLAENQANPILTQIAAQLDKLNGEMALGILAGKTSALFAMELPESKGVATVINMLGTLMSKEKSLSFKGMSGKVRNNAIRTRGGSLHQLELKPQTDQLKARYGRSVSAYFGVVSDTLLTVFGKNSKSQAKTLTAKNGKISGKSQHLPTLLKLSQSQGESLVVAIDAMSLKMDQVPRDINPLVLGLGFEGNQIRFRANVSADFIRELARGPQAATSTESKSAPR